MPDLSCRVVPVDSAPGVAVVHLKGAIDPKNLTTLQTMLSGNRFRILVFDLGEIRYINSAGLGYLVNLSDSLAAQGGGLCLANPQPKVKVVFDLMGVTQFFKLYKSVDAVIAAIARARRPSRPRSPAPSGSRRS